MKHARVVIDGKVHLAEARSEDRVLLLQGGGRAKFDDVVWLPPVEPRTIFALGLNYPDHAMELSFKAPPKPLVFLKGPDSLVGDHGTSECPADVEQMHAECELAVIIGKQARRITKESAYDYVAGYSVAIDYAFREYLENFFRPNFKVKNRDHCTPMGPWMVDAADVSDPMNLELRATVNGDVVQHSNTNDMIFSIGSVIEYLSEFMTLSPGDIILTGSPHGVRFLNPGDEIVAEVKEIGCLRNKVTAEEARNL